MFVIAPNGWKKQAVVTISENGVLEVYRGFKLIYQSKFIKKFDENDVEMRKDPDY